MSQRKAKVLILKKSESHHGKGKEPTRNPSKKKNMTNVKCYNYGNKVHFARDCNEPKKVYAINVFSIAIYVLSSILLIESNLSWTVDLGATDHVERDISSFMKYCRISCGTKWIYVGNNTIFEVKGIDTCKLCMRGGQTLYLYDVLFVPEIRQKSCFCTYSF